MPRPRPGRIIRSRSESPRQDKFFLIFRRLKHGPDFIQPSTQKSYASSIASNMRPICVLNGQQSFTGLVERQRRLLSRDEIDFMIRHLDTILERRADMNADSISALVAVPGLLFKVPLSIA